MQLNHLDLSVPDVAATAAFFEAAFGFTLLQTKGNAGMAILRGEGGVVLVLTRAAPVDHAPYPKTFHIGFLVPSDAEVWVAYESVRRTGIDLPHEPQAVRGGLGFYFHAPGGIMVEVGHRAAG